VRRMWLAAAAVGLVHCFAAAAGFAQSSAVTATILDVAGKALDVEGKTLDVKSQIIGITGKTLDIIARIQGMEVKQSPQEVHIELPADVLFDFDKSDIRHSAEPALKQAADLLRRQARGTVEIDGHTDSKGTPAYNQKLSQRRAESVRRWLVEREGLTRTRFMTRGFGATRPVAPNTKPDGSDNPEGRQRNRRVEIIFRR
jgi:outer membrane protein OmpA-like peptidoglycan-associated protein